MPASRASTSTASQPVSTTGENAMMSTPCSMKPTDRLDLVLLRLPWASVNSRSIPACVGGVLDRLGVGRAPSALGADLGEAHRVLAEIGDLDDRPQAPRLAVAGSVSSGVVAQADAARHRRTPSVSAAANALTLLLQHWILLQSSAEPAPTIPLERPEHGRLVVHSRTFTMARRQVSAATASRCLTIGTVAFTFRRIVNAHRRVKSRDLSGRSVNVHRGRCVRSVRRSSTSSASTSARCRRGPSSCDVADGRRSARRCTPTATA